ncbi:helix-turn-helix domain-containing protein [Chungangia koreensis]|uniref:Helix-turn-helix domain-containing protein n=1 Tax=Chungangia koreensis TaxID=752657 RepID=A0ABV8X6Y6_9LACT
MSSNTLYETIVEEAIDYMKRNLDRELTTEEVARAVGYSESHFIRVFKEVTGISPRHFLSALRIEEGKKKLLQPDGSLLKVVLSLGFLSVGSFGSRFKQTVGVSPVKFRKTSEKLAENLMLEKELSNQEEAAVSSISCTVHYPKSFKGVIFVGVFPRPIPDQRPIKGTAFKNGRHECSFADIPVGDYYILAAGIPWSMNPKTYFLLENSLRGKTENPIHIEKDTKIAVELFLREPLPYDPPILVNLPMLFLESQNSNVEEKIEKR